MMERNTIPLEVLFRVLACNVDAGILAWLPRSAEMFTSAGQASRWNTRYAFKEAFTATNDGGYRKGTLLGRPFSAHRIIWAFAYNEWPQDQIDHINGNRTDNRISNLRLSSNEINSKNKKLQKNNSSGVVGICHRWGKWVARIQINGKSVNLGHFLNKEDAITARKIAEAKHDFHPNHGRIVNNGPPIIPDDLIRDICSGEYLGPLPITSEPGWDGRKS